MATATTPPPTATDHALESALLAKVAAERALGAHQAGASALEVGTVVATYQATTAAASQSSVAAMLLEQDITETAEALLSTVAFTTDATRFADMLTAVERREDLRFSITAPSREELTQGQFDAEFTRLIESLMQDAARAAESVATAVRADVGHVRMLTPPSCARCAVLAGRVYRWSDGFLRHPNCDCVMIPTTVANDQLVQDPLELLEQGLVTGLSKADQRAVADGADIGQVVNVRRLSAGLQQAGRVLARRGRPTPEGIYAVARTREEAVELLAAAGYIL